MGDTRKFRAKDDPSFEPEVLTGSGLQPTSKPHRVEGRGKKTQRGTGTHKAPRVPAIGGRHSDKRAGK